MAREDLYHTTKQFVLVYFSTQRTLQFMERGFQLVRSLERALVYRQRLIVVAVVIAISQHGGCQWFPYDPNDQWTFFSSESRPSTEQLVR